MLSLLPKMRLRIRDETSNQSFQSPVQRAELSVRINSIIRSYFEGQSQFLSCPSGQALGLYLNIFFNLELSIRLLTCWDSIVSQPLSVVRDENRCCKITQFMLHDHLLPWVVSWISTSWRSSLFSSKNYIIYALL